VRCQEKTDLDATFSNSIRLAGRGNLPAAVDGLLEILRQNRQYRNGLGTAGGTWPVRITGRRRRPDTTVSLGAGIHFVLTHSDVEEYRDIGNELQVLTQIFHQPIAPTVSRGRF
jgi:hypothetical protein